ncbi:RICIN domain-containing protein [Streptomyces noursei]|uniref:RICIN domain-containing protein n=1 Tax=Streptomyces noursei TaxID=1971 RepID=UPI00081C86E0|nr:Elongation factor Tu GTP binding domain/Ricin-type beta-trefoil lectin domain [Streptomyces noursei ATCC 11455]MCZ0996304.1 RICIN domain-containing protein [Streptomyces noursei]
MAASGFQGIKPELTIASLGDAGHGKTTTATALARVLAKAAGGEARAGEVALGSGVRRFDYETSQRRYRHLDCPGADVTSLLKSHSVDGAVLVVSALDGVMPQAREHVREARAAGVPAIVTLLNKYDGMVGPDADEVVDLVEMEIRLLLSRHGYDDDGNAPVIRGSAQRAAQDDPMWTNRVAWLGEALDTHLPVPPAGAPRAQIPTRARLVARHSGKVLDVDGGAAKNDNGARIQQWDWVGWENQKWRIEPVGDSYYRLVAKHSGKVLDVSGGPGETRNGARVHQWEWVGGDNQKWRIEPVGDGYYRLVAKHSGKVLDVDGGAAKNDNGTHVQQWDWVGWENQMWRLDPIQDSDW